MISPAHPMASETSQTPAPSPSMSTNVAVPPVNGTVPQASVEPYTRTVHLDVPTTNTPSRGRRWGFSRPVKAPATSKYKDPWYTKSAEEYPAGYPSLAAYMSDDIDGRIYRRFSFLRNHLLLYMQDKLNALEQVLELVDRDDEEKAKNGEIEALYRLTSRRYNERTANLPPDDGPQPCGCCHTTTNQQALPGAPAQTTNPAENGGLLQPKSNATRRMEILRDVENTLEKYDELLLREHEISSIRESTAKQRASLGNFIWNGKPCGPGKNKKPLASQENKLIYRKDDSVLLGTQEDAWLGTAAESMKRLMPAVMRRYLLMTREDREKSKASTTEYLSNHRVNSFVKAVVSVASTILLVLPIIILYALSTSGASGWLKIGILLIFVVAFALALSVLTNASRSEMFGASAGYTAVLIVFLTFTGS
ncbi:hypothetical protein PV04_04940 [Phialophora macrospora]|uniref:DUF6594 domain-containing protein n=1 Tax=Phialophora macrospora TaxID=1851006 RepID=A0A0D2CV82_9EURO|nr:hypothetical protein PV04_04940 [Phialophora macrospora]